MQYPRARDSDTLSLLLSKLNNKKTESSIAAAGKPTAIDGNKDTLTSRLLSKRNSKKTKSSDVSAGKPTAIDGNKDTLTSLLLSKHNNKKTESSVAAAGKPTAIHANKDALTSLLLAKQNNKKTESSVASATNAETKRIESSVVDTTTIALMSELLSGEDYLSAVEQLQKVPDVENLLDFMIHLLRNGHFSSSSDLSKRARRLMFKVLAKIPVMPPSLIITQVILPAKRDYIGGGGFGRVLKGTFNGRVVALKILLFKTGNDVAFCREALMWGLLKHKFLLPFLGIYELNEGSVPEFFLVSPYMKNGTLAEWRKTTNPSVAEVEKRIYEVAQGVEYIHSEDVVHGDLRGDNVLLDANLHVQITDFGLTRLSEATNTRTGANHPNFAAPELFGYSEGIQPQDDDAPLRTQMSDVYAFGSLYYEIHYGRMPFAGRTDMQIMTLALRGTLPPYLDEPPLSDWAWNIIRHCWERKAANRPKIKDVVESMKARFQPTFPRNNAENHQRSSELKGAVDIPSHSSTSSRVPTPLPPGYHLYNIHPLLSGQDFQFNLSLNQFAPMQNVYGRHFPLDDETLAQPATHPPIYDLQIVCNEIPDWPIVVEGTTGPVTLGDALFGIHEELHTRITQQDYAGLDKEKMEHVNQAYYKRCMNPQPALEARWKADGVKKVDYLLDKVMFKRLDRTAEGPEVMRLIVSRPS